MEPPFVARKPLSAEGLEPLAAAAAEVEVEELCAPQATRYHPTTPTLAMSSARRLPVEIRALSSFTRRSTSSKLSHSLQFLSVRQGFWQRGNRSV